MSTIISDVKSKALFMGNVNGSGKAQNVQSSDSFSAVFDKTQNPTEAPGENTTVKTEDAEKLQGHANVKENKASKQLKEQTEEVKAVKDEETIEAEVTEAAEKMVEEIAKTFDVSVEEVEKVLETLGLTVVDLLNTENLTKVVLAMNPECDALSLMTNEALFADLKGLMNTAQDLKNGIVQNFNLTEEEMAAILNSMKEKVEMPVVEETPIQEIPDLAETVTEAAPNTVSVEVDVTEVMADMTKEAVSERSDVKTVEITDATYDGTVIPKTETSQNVRNSSAETSQDGNNASAQQFTQNFVNQLAEAVENANSSTTSYNVSGQDIINQITEHIRIHVKQDTTEMELQLHPASLGNVKVQLTSVGGVLTAVFTTENEAVKAALEGQLIQLKENFAQQGLKVESVEVNVSAQGFERSLDQQEQEQNRSADSRNRRTNRRIRLNGLEEADDILAEDMTADDRIVADMMIRNGNTVDYTV